MKHPLAETYDFAPWIYDGHDGVGDTWRCDRHPWLKSFGQHTHVDLSGRREDGSSYSGFSVAYVCFECCCEQDPEIASRREWWLEQEQDLRRNARTRVN